MSKLSPEINEGRRRQSVREMYPHRDLLCQANVPTRVHEFGHNFGFAHSVPDSYLTLTAALTLTMARSLDQWRRKAEAC